ncbi:MAG: hypothetical protein H7Z12_05390 [Rhodospirillaceae bacterium]|nr:hypothetical protein [Rhodospirillales bacterium]
MAAEGTKVAEPVDGKAAEAAPRHPCFDVLSMMAEVVNALAEERAQGGMLRLEDLKRILEMTKGAGSPLARAFASQEGKCRRAFRPATRHASSRNDVFRRLMVRPFETLLEGEPPAFPRCFLANYFELVEAAFGDKFKSYDDRSREIFQDMLVIHGNDLAWDVFFNDARTRAVLGHALTRLMHYIESPAGQWAWLTCLNRQNVDGAKPSSEQADLILSTLRTTRKALGPMVEKKA